MAYSAIFQPTSAAMTSNDGGKMADIHHLHSNNYDVVFCWIPSHIGIAGNEKADQAAKSVLNLPNITSYPLPYSDITSSIKNTFHQVATPLA